MNPLLWIPAIRRASLSTGLIGLLLALAATPAVDLREQVQQKSSTGSPSTSAPQRYSLTANDTAVKVRPPVHTDSGIVLIDAETPSLRAVSALSISNFQTPSTRIPRQALGRAPPSLLSQTPTC